MRITHRKIDFATEFKILIQNAQSISNKIDLIDSLTKGKNYQAICFTETWIQEKKKDLITIPGYLFASTFIRQKRKGGGVAVLLKDNIQYRELPDIVKLSIENITELCAVELMPNVLLIVIYRCDREIGSFPLDRLTVQSCLP